MIIVFEYIEIDIYWIYSNDYFQTISDHSSILLLAPSYVTVIIALFKEKSIFHDAGSSNFFNCSTLHKLEEKGITLHTNHMHLYQSQPYII